MVFELYGLDLLMQIQICLAPVQFTFFRIALMDIF